MEITLERDLLEPDALPAVRCRQGFPLEVVVRLMEGGAAIGDWRAGLVAVRCELKAARSPQSAALAVVELDGAALAASPAEGPVFGFTAGQLSQVLGPQREREKFHLTVVGEGSGGEPVDFGEAVLWLVETNATWPSVSPPAVPDIYATQAYVLEQIAANPGYEGDRFLTQHDANNLAVRRVSDGQVEGYIQITESPA